MVSLMNKISQGYLNLAKEELKGFSPRTSIVLYKNWKNATVAKIEEKKRMKVMPAEQNGKT